jgi:hypothetical protein
MPPTMQQVLEEAEKAAEGAQWRASEPINRVGELEHSGDVRGFEADKDGWHFIVVSFDIENQGFPPGSRGYDGACRNTEKGTVLHLTRELAEKFYKAAIV